MTNLKIIREQRGISQAQLAAMLGITQGAVSQWENGTAKPTFDNIKKLAAVLNCTVDDLLKEPLEEA